MKCPYCNNLMEQGIIESQEPMNFLKSSHFVNQPKKSQGEFTIAKAGFGTRAKVTANYCRSCGKLIIDC